MERDEARARLQRQRHRLLELEEGRREAADLDDSQRDSTGELSGRDQHPGDVATETFERTRELSIGESVAERLQEIDHAMARVDDGTYGHCEVCGREIDPDRLELRPEARYCVEHQHEAERAAQLGTLEPSPGEEPAWDPDSP